jgi:predicted ATPase
VGDLAAAERLTAILLDLTEKHSLNSFHPFGLGFAGELSAARGNFVGVRLLRACLDGLRETLHRTFYVVFLGGLAKALAAIGNVEEGLITIDEALGRAEHNGEAWYVPELLRIKGEVLLSHREPNAIDAEDQFLRSLVWARREGALSWELRSATSLARLWRDQARTKEAHELLAPVYHRFTEGFDTVDVKGAKALLETLR